MTTSATADPTADPKADLVPTIDLADSHGVRAKEVSASIGEACESTGFFVIVNHGVPTEAIDAVYRSSVAFFEQDATAKRLGAADPPNRYRGYTAPSDRPGYDDAPTDLVESFEAAHWEHPDSMVAAGYAPELVRGYAPNVWPPSPPDMPDIWRAYMGEMEGLAGHLMSLMAGALGLPDDWFAGTFDRHCSYLTANYYPAQLDAPPPGQLRQSAHTDFGSLTILYQDTDVGGLQVRAKDGSWIDMPFVAGAYVVNIGDLLAKWTNDRWVATEHRVVNPGRHQTQRPRVSIPYFQHPNLDAVIEAIPTCVPPGEAPTYPAVRAGDWAAFRMSGYARVHGQ